MVELNQNNIVDIIDIAQKHYKTIKEILARFLPYKKVIAYGSRVKWNASETSDLDLVVFNSTEKQIYEAKEAFDESNIPFIIQILNWETIPQDFKENIERKYHILQKEDDWGIFKLGEVAKINMGQSPKSDFYNTDNIGLPFLQGNRTFGIKYPSFDTYCSEPKKIAKKGEVLFSVRAPVGDINWAHTDICIGRGLASFESYEDDVFLYYLLHHTKQDIIQAETGSVFGSVSKGDLETIEIHLPPLPEQKAIAEILSSLDDKIDLLHCQNKTLENLAETLFRHYFIDNAKDDWKERQLDEIADYLNGLACQKHPPKNDVEKLPVLKIKDLRNGFTENSDWATSDVAEEYIVKNGDIIFSWSGSLLVKIWDGKECVLNQHLFKVTSAEYPKWFIYHWTKYHLDKFTVIAESKATTMGHIKRSDLSSSMVVVPTEEFLNEIDQSMQPIMDKVILNNRQIARLEKLRDTLLPKLISGDIRVNYSQS